MVQVPAGATEVQLLACENEVELPPLMTMPENVNVPLPVFVTVTGVGEEFVPTVCAAKAMLVGAKLMAGVAVTPVQVIETVWGEPAALSVMLMEAENAAAERGAQVATMVQLPPAKTELPQLLDCEKSAVFAPVRPMLAMVSVPAPVFVRVTLFVALMLPTFTLPKARLAGLKETTGVPPPLTSGWG
jgi:hypothetical protein